jgi:hypothetical protein
MPIDLSGNLDRFEADDLRQFTWIDTVSVPSTISFAIYNTDGSALAPVAVQSGVTVTISGGDITKGMFYVFRQLPSSRGLYTQEWKAYGSGSAQSSLFITVRGMFEIYRTEPRSFSTYGDKGNVLRIAKQLIGRGDLTEYDVEPHMKAAYGYINSRLGGVMTTPFGLPAPSYIAQGEEFISVYTLYGSFGATEKGDIPAAFEKLRDDFVEYLDKLVEGEATVDGVIPSIGGPVSHITGGIVGGTPIFGRRDFPEQSIDQNILELEESQDD